MEPARSFRGLRRPELPAGPGGRPGRGEAALMAAARAGCRESFSELALRHRRGALALALDLVRSRDDAEDIVQEALLRAWRARGRFEPGRPFAPWFYRILRNACIQHLCERHRHRERPAGRFGTNGAETDLEDAALPWPDQQASLEGGGRRLAAALGALPSRDRELLLLRHFLDLSYRQIADLLAVPVNTVRWRLAEARERLGRRVGDLRAEVSPRLPSPALSALLLGLAANPCRVAPR